MNIATARRLDGLLVPWVRAWSRCRRQAPPVLPADLPELGSEGPVVVLKLVGLGSLVLLAPTLMAFQQRTGRRVVLLTVVANRPLLDLIDWGVEPAYLHTVPNLALWSDALRFLHRLRRSHPAAVVDLEFHSALTTLLGRALRAPVHTAVDAPWRRGLVPHGIQVPEDCHFADLSRTLFSALAGAPLSPSPAIPWRSGCLTPLPSSSRKRVAVNINAGEMCLERRVPTAVFRALMLDLAQHLPVEFHLLGDSREADFTNGFAASLPADLPVVNHAGKLDVAALLGVLQSVDLLITNDTGPMHFAVAIGTPTLAVFGPESPLRYGPRGPRDIMVWGRMPCSPCLSARNRKQAPCRGDNRCLQQVTAADLLPGALRILAGGGGELLSIASRLDPPTLHGPI